LGDRSLAHHLLAQWDEQKYGLEYDLSDFNIVAVNDFNMGAMENKGALLSRHCTKSIGQLCLSMESGLNIFNSKYLLVHPKTVTDDDLLNVERVIAHEVAPRLSILLSDVT